MRRDPKGRHLVGRALVLGAIVATSLWCVSSLPDANPIRVIAGLLLVILLPGIGARDALIDSDRRLAPWESLALIGALGLGTSSVACVTMLAASIPLTVGSVGLACGLITIAGEVVAIARGGLRRTANAETYGAFGILVVLTTIALGSVVGAALAERNTAERFTVLAFEDPGAARTTLERAAAQRAPASLDIVVESHEAAVETYELRRDGIPLSPPFTLQPSERRVISIPVDGRDPGGVRIDLVRDGTVYRSLRLTPP
jgi:hypothetical protein